MTYRLSDPSHSDFGEGETLLEAISDGRIFDIEPYGVGFRLTERCDDYFSLVLTAPQLYQLGTELRELAKIQPASEETTTMSNLSPAAQSILDAFRTSHTGQGCLAAALRAAAELELQQPWPTSIEGCGARWMRDQLLAIASELEGRS